VIQLAARVVSLAGPGKPADAVLRDVLRRERDPGLGGAREVSRTVFSFYRWRGWASPGAPVEQQIGECCELARRFAQTPEKFSDAELSRAVPDWIREAMEFTPEWLRSLQAEPALWLRAKRGQGNALAQKLGDCWIPPEPRLADAVQYRGEDDLFRSPEFHTGEFEIQDIASQLVGLLCDPQPGETWWDACAGEGGKTLHLSDLMANKGLIWASDRAEWRLKHLKRRAGRAKCFNYRSTLWDGGAKLPTKTTFDGVLVDAPCSGVGTWGRNPHARWTTTAKDVRELAAVQKQLLSHVASGVRPGGKLIYAACTLTRAETSGVTEWFSADVEGFEPLALNLNIERLVTSSPAITLWPQQTGGNGMFVAAWRRRG
jgi:16S rRNA (cytosine967-C5)-methyltransferase